MYVKQIEILLKTINSLIRLTVYGTWHRRVDVGEIQRMCSLAEFSKAYSDFYGRSKRELHDMMQWDLRANLQVSLLDIGSCNLHIVHGCFKDGAKASGWELDRFM